MLTVTTVDDALLGRAPFCQLQLCQHHIIWPVVQRWKASRTHQPISVAIALLP